MHKIGKSGEFLGRHLGPLVKAVLSLMKNFLKPLVTTASESATDAAIHKTMFGSGMTMLIISNE